MSFYTGKHLKAILKGAVKKYNKTHEVALPKITPHILRYLLYKTGTKENEPKEFTVHYGACEYHAYIEFICSCVRNRSKHENVKYEAGFTTKCTTIECKDM